MYSKTLPVSRAFRTFFSVDDRHVIAAWNENPRRASPHLVVRTSANRVDAVDLMGNRAGVPTADGRVLLRMSAEPTYWIFSGSAPEPSLEGPLAAPTGRSVAVPNAPVSLSVELWNPTTDTLNFDIQWDLHDRLRSPSGDSSKSVCLTPGERQQAAIDVQPASGQRISFAAAMPCAVTYRCDPIDWSGRLEVPVTMGAVVIPQGDVPKDLVFRLQHIDQVVNLSEHDPHTAHLLWKGREDLSAEVRGARTGEGLELLVDVRDNQHCVSPTNALEVSDHLELLICVPCHEQVLCVRVADIDGGERRVVTNEIKKDDEAASGVRVDAWGETPLRHYRIKLSNEVLGISEVALRKGIRLNLRVHDNDGQGQKGWIQLAPGNTPEDVAGWPLLLMKENQDRVPE